MTGNAPDMRAFARLAREHDAGLYVDDAHGFGVVGERGRDELCDWGKRGNGIIRHQGEAYENVVLVAGLSAAYSSLLAFLALPRELKGLLKVAASPYLYSGPSPVASLATALVGLEVNERRGDLYRYEAHRKTQRVLDLLHELDVFTPNRSGYPLIQVPLARPEELGRVGRFLFERGIYVTMAPYPLVPRDEVGIRMPDHPLALKIIHKFGPITSTSANLHSHPDPVNLKNTVKEMGGSVSVYLDCGSTKLGKHSTIIAVHEKEMEVIRQGVIPIKEIEAALHG